MKHEIKTVSRRIAAAVLSLGFLLACGCGEGQQEPPTEPTEQTEATFAPVDPALLAYEESFTPPERSMALPSDWTKEEPTLLTIGNEQFSASLDLSSGIVLTSLFDVARSHEYLSEPSGLFTYRVRTNLNVGGFESSAILNSGDSVRVKEVLSNTNGTAYAIRASAASLPIDFTVLLTLGASFVDVQIELQTRFADDILINVNCPNLSEVVFADDVGEVLACVPQEIGWTGPYDALSTYGAADIVTSGLLEVPCALNAMELAAVYAGDFSGGIYFADMEGDISQRIPRVQMAIINRQISGYYAYTAQAGETVLMPTVRIGTFTDGDWHKAVDTIMQDRPDALALAQDIPAWIRECGGVYATRGIGSGACYMLTDFADSSARYITDYRQMTALLDRAEEFGTNVIMLCDYQIPAKASEKWSEITQGVDLSQYEPSRYLTSQENKGDYLHIRQDWGGNDAFREGVAAVHARGGKVIVYMESFIVYQLSMLSEEVKDFAAILPDGALDATYDDFYSMVGSDERWQTLLTELAVMMVQEYDVDGIFFDSYGCHFNQLFAAAGDQEFIEIQEYNAQLLVLMNRIRTAIRRVKPDAVVLAETGSGEALHVTDGGWTADFAWFMKNSAGTILTSPLKYAQPQANIFSNGKDMNELHQVFAAGFGLCVCDYFEWELNIAEIKGLIEIRKTYADALVYGTQSILPRVSQDGIGSAYFEGNEHRILTVVNTLPEEQTVSVALGTQLAGKSFTELQTSESYSADATGMLSLPIASEGLLVLLQTDEGMR